MKVIKIGVLVALTAFAGLSTTAQENWKNEKVIQINTVKPHSTMFAFNNAKDAKSFDREKSGNFKLLNGDWKFNWVAKPADRPKNFFKTSFDDRKWKTIPVPANWEIQGYGMAVYTNVTYPFPKNAPKIPHSDNPVGSYRTTFTTPKNWSEKETFITFDGVSSAFFLWVNGEKVGYSQGSRTPAEFNITKFLKSGKNILAAEVYRWCDGSYLEDQDFWRLSGIFRDVYLQARNPQFIKDFTVETDLDENNQDATLNVNIELAKKTKATVELTLFDKSGKNVATKKGASKFKIQLTNPKKWTNEKPYLYDMFLTLKNTKGRTLEVIPQKVGFRETLVKDGVFYVNGVPVKIKGVNRHETHPDLGQHVTRESILKDIKLWKENNINAVRTCHYPNDPIFYTLCDEYGIWVMNEANIETHDYGNGHGNHLATSPDWKEQHLNRMRRMVARDKNHPSIIFWSMGNEAGSGPNFTAGREMIHKLDSTRPVHYEGGNKVDSDISSQMYAGQGWLGGPDRPSILCEYTHAMGNSNGNLSEYWDDNIYKKKRHVGGYVWDWMDQGIRKPVPTAFRKNIGKGPVKKTAFAYGGWEQHNYNNDGNFCMNGLVGSDWTPHPGLFAIKYAYRNIHVKAIDLAAGKFSIKSWYDYTNLNEIVDAKWQILENGNKIYNGVISALDIAARTEKEISIKFPKIAPKAGAEYFIILTFTAKENYSSLVKTGHELAFAQFKLPISAAVRLTNPAKVSAVKLKKSATKISITGKNFAVEFDKRSGTMTNYSFKGHKLIKRGPKLDLWRAFTDNDKAPIANGSYSKKWRDAVSSESVSAVTVTKISPQAIRVQVDATLPTVSSAYSIAYTIYGNGEVDVDVQVDKSQARKSLKNPHRIGTELIITEKYNQMKWYGRGPNPTYIDRNFERIGKFGGSVDEQWVDYSRPQENGNKTDVRWLTMTDKRGNGLLFSAEGAALSVGAKHYSKETIEASDYSFKMERVQNIFLNIDHKQLGVGGNNSWGATALGHYQLYKPKYTYSYRIRPITHNSSVESLLQKSVDAFPVDFKNLTSGVFEKKERDGDYSASSVEPGKHIRNAFDGKLKTRWCAENGKIPQWIAMDLKKSTALKGIEIIWESKAKYNYYVLVSNDEKKWKKVASCNQRGEKFTHKFDEKARYVKINCNGIDGGKWVSIREIKTITK